MKVPKKPPNEAARLREVYALGELGTRPEERFDRVTRLAQRLFGVPFAAVTLIDEDSVWFISRQGLELDMTPRRFSFCNETILEHAILHVADATKDLRFSYGPMVKNSPHVHFYAGYPVRGPLGTNLGTLCIMSDEPRELTASEGDSLRDLAEIVEQEIASHHLESMDILTGLSNRHGFELLAAKALAASRRRNMPATLLYIGLDDFKSSDNELDSENGDQTLREFARLLEQEFRESDIVARLGASEFTVLLGDADNSEIATQRLLATIRERNAASHDSVEITAYVGASYFDPRSEDTFDSLLNRADVAMNDLRYSR
ncbi:MAG: GGDEF domain-containing protein [Acidimicrobiales bacterium]